MLNKRWVWIDSKKKANASPVGEGHLGENGNETEGAQVSCQNDEKTPKTKETSCFSGIFAAPRLNPPPSLLPTMSTPSCGGAETIPCSIKVLLLIPFLLMMISRSTCCVGKNTQPILTRRILNSDSGSDVSWCARSNKQL